MTNDQFSMTNGVPTMRAATSGHIQPILDWSLVIGHWELVITRP
jgi:hypothetical protein